MTPLYQVSRKRRIIDLLGAPALPMAGLALAAYLVVLFVPNLGEGVDFLRQHGPLAWCGALLVLVPVSFYGWFGWACVLCCGPGPTRCRPSPRPARGW